MADIDNTGSVSPRQRKMYEQEYKQGADLFQRALEQATKSQNPYQKEQFDEVMAQALEVVSQAARGLKRSDLVQESEKMEKDFQVYRQDPSQAHIHTLEQDVSRAKRFIV